MISFDNGIINDIIMAEQPPTIKLKGTIASDSEPPPPPPPPPPSSHPPRHPSMISSGGRRSSKSSISPTSPKQQQQQQHKNNISIDTIVASQFENEAETHILAALEIEERDQSNLLGEGIDTTGAMDDYSDDDEEDDIIGTGRPRTYSTDSFLKRVHKQNDQPQYSYEVPENAASPPPSPTPSQRHRRFISSSASRGSGYLPSVPDDSALLYDYLERNDLGDDQDTSCLEDITTSGGGGGEEEGGGVGGSAVNVDSEENATTRSHFDSAASTVVNIKTDANATGNVTTMANRLAQLQRSGTRRFSLGRTSSQRDTSLSERSDTAPSSSHDKLIDALNGVDSASRGWFAKMRYEWNLLIVPKLPTFRKHISHVLFFLVLPCLAVASILFYMFDNPMAGNTGTSISWWIIFIGARQAITLGFTWIGQTFWVEILALRSKLFNTIVGPYVSLAIIQSSG